MLPAISAARCIKSTVKGQGEFGYAPVEKSFEIESIFKPCQDRHRFRMEPGISDLSAQANCDTGEGGDGIPGWVDEPNNYLIDFPSGEQTLRGVPFQIASASQNGHRVCIGVSASPKYATKTQVPVHGPCRSFYLLHACSGREATLGKLTIHYNDGSKQIEYIERGTNVGSFWAPQDLEFNNRYGALAQERMQVAWRGKSGLIDNVGVWITSFENHKSDAVVASLELESMESGSKWFVIGITLSNMPAFLPPWNDISSGMPNNWGAGCVTAALLEGLAGVEDTGAGFRTARISPRWLAAGNKEAQVSVRYPASRGYVFYHYSQQGNTITLDCTSCADKTTLRVPLPAGKRVTSAPLNGKAITPRLETVEQSEYLIAEVDMRGVHGLKLDLA
jgi:hypothetical protein